MPKMSPRLSNLVSRTQSEQAARESAEAATAVGAAKLRPVPRWRAELMWTKILRP